MESVGLVAAIALVALAGVRRLMYMCPPGYPLTVPVSAFLARKYPDLGVWEVREAAGPRKGFPTVAWGDLIEGAVHDAYLAQGVREAVSLWSPFVEKAFVAGIIPFPFKVSEDLAREIFQEIVQEMRLKELGRAQRPALQQYVTTKKRAERLNPDLFLAAPDLSLQAPSMRRVTEGMRQGGLQQEQRDAMRGVADLMRRKKMDQGEGVK